MLIIICRIHIFLYLDKVQTVKENNMLRPENCILKLIIHPYRNQSTELNGFHISVTLACYRLRFSRYLDSIQQPEKLQNVAVAKTLLQNYNLLILRILTKKLAISTI